MNTSSQTAPRINRIQKASKAIRISVQYGIPLLIVLLPLLGITGVRDFVMDTVGAAARESAIHPHSLWVSLGRILLFAVWYKTILRLFGTFEKGILFTDQTVRYIKLLGTLSIASWLLEFVFQIGFANPATRMVFAGIGSLFSGLLTFFIGWLIDEARKLQEEQALTI